MIADFIDHMSDGPSDARREMEDGGWTIGGRASGSCPAHSSADERDQRLMLSEAILSDLSTGYWVAILDDNDDPVKEKMGQRILNYWRKWKSPPNVGDERRGER